MSTNTEHCASHVDLNVVRAAVKHLDTRALQTFIHLVEYKDEKREHLTSADDIEDLYFLTVLCRELGFDYKFYPTGCVPQTLAVVLEEAARGSLLPPNSINVAQFDRVIAVMQRVARKILP